jgi:hypothetical protein
VAFYRNLDRHIPDDRIAHVDAAGSVDEVHARVLSAYAEAFGALPP